MSVPQSGLSRRTLRKTIRTPLAGFGIAAACASALAPPAPGADRAMAAEDRVIALHSRRVEPPQDRAGALGALAAGPPGRHHVLVQFERLPGEESRLDLERAGLRLLGALPGGAFFASVPAGLSPAAPALAEVRWIGLLEPADRLSPLLRDGSIAPGPDGLVELDVRPFEDEDAGALAARLAGPGRLVRGLWSDGRSIRIAAPPSDLPALAAVDAIRWIGPAPPPLAMHNDQSRSSIGADVLHAPPYSLRGGGVDLGIWDGGCVDAHGDFGSRLTVAELVCPTGVTETRHATHVAGTMAGDGALSASAGGTAFQWEGMAPAAGIVSYDFNGDIIAEIGTAIADPIRSIELSQNSWSYGMTSGTCGFLGFYDGFCADYDRVVRGSQGKKIAVFFSAGNNRNNVGTCGMTGPAPFVNYTSMMPLGTAKNVITVGAVYSDDDTMTDFSSWGPTNDGRIKPDVVAPGCGLSAAQHVRSTFPGGSYASMCGTSMSTPAASGAAGLLWEQHRSVYGTEPLPSTIKALLIHTARDLDSGAGFLTPGPDYASGYGRINAKKAADRIAGRAVTEGNVGAGETDIFSVDIVEGDAGVRMTLAWDDPAAMEAAAVTLVNDLDLIVLDPDGTRHYPWTLDPANPGAAAVRTGEDHRNNVEQVWAPAPYAAGAWSVRVAGTSVPQGPQAYSLVVTPDAGFEPFGPDDPEEGATFAPNAPPETFSWHPGAMETFRAEWSNTEGFTDKVKKSSKQFTPETSFTPADDLWLKILKLGRDSGTAYWRIAAKDINGTKAVSAVRALNVMPAGPAAFTAPPDGAAFARTDPPPTFSWDDGGNSKFKIIFSAKPEISKPKKKSGDTWLTDTSWTPSQGLWDSILGLAAKGDGTTVYYQIVSKDALKRVSEGPVRTLLVTP